MRESTEGRLRTRMLWVLTVTPSRMGDVVWNIAVGRKTDGWGTAMVVMAPRRFWIVHKVTVKFES
jgi:hypothetical protein